MSESAATTAIEDVLDMCATCRAACPVYTDTRGYIDLIARGRYVEAFEKIRATNPFPSVCAAICHHPCEQACRRQHVDEPVAIRNLKRFAVERALEHRRESRKAATITKDKTIGVVGAGPAGLAVATDVIRAGYAVTVYDSLPSPGGNLAYAIPKYRLLAEDLSQDIEDITALGVEVKCGVKVGTDVTLDDLAKKHDAVVIAVGLYDSRMLPLEGTGNVTDAMNFLRSIALDKAPDVPESVIVVGGGNVAVDVARSAVRLGATSVKMVMLESEDEMPAWEWECREALEEGIALVHSRGPVKVDSSGLVVREVTRVFDDDGRFSPEYDDSKTETIPGDMVILSIGQQSDIGFVDGTGVKASRPGRLDFDPEAMTTTLDGVFACGEVITGPGSAIEAVASGHRAASAVMSWLETGKVVVTDIERAEEVGELGEDVIERVRRIERLAMPTMSPDERKKSFAQFELGYSEKDALAEARRCLSCTAGAEVDEGKCEACLTCLRICPFGVPVVDDIAVMCSDLCQACGLCAVECPARAISIRRFAVGDIRDRITALLADTKLEVKRVIICCNQDAEDAESLVDRIELTDDGVVAVFPVACAARAEEVDMMKPFEYGVETVVVRTCGDCRYPGALDRIQKRVARTSSILAAAGIGGDRLQYECKTEESDS